MDWNNYITLKQSFVIIQLYNEYIDYRILIIINNTINLILSVVYVTDK
jgi:hypothetical protein